MNTRWAGAALAVAAVLLVTSCNGQDKPSAKPSATGKGSGTTSPSVSAGVQAAVDKAYAPVTAAPAVATTKGKVPRTDLPAVIEIVSVAASSTGTQLVWRLRSADGQDHALSGALGLVPVDDVADHTDTRDIRLVNPGAGQYAEAYGYVVDGHPQQCVCADLPHNLLGAGTELTNEYPPLPTDLAAVDLVIPGFATVKGVKVARS